MSQENVELVRRSTQAFNERDVPTLEALYTEDCILRLIGGLADVMGTEFRGQGALLVWSRDIIDTVGGTSEIEELREVGDRVLMIATAHWSGATSHAPVMWRDGQVYSFRAGQIRTVDSYYEVEEALKAVEE